MRGGVAIWRQMLFSERKLNRQRDTISIPLTLKQITNSVKRFQFQYVDVLDSIQRLCHTNP